MITATPIAWYALQAAILATLTAIAVTRPVRYPGRPRAED